MRIDRLQLWQFRNIETAKWTPSPQVNIVCGENAQGKTNLLEAIWLFTGGRSFRRAKDSELVRFGCPTARLSCDFFGEGREQTATLTIDRRRKATLGGVPQASAGRLTGHFTAVVFSPDHLSMVKDGPEGRRRFLDTAICQLRPAYVQVLSEYTRLLQQRNALLRGGRFSGDRELLPIFTRRLATAGSAVLWYRLAGVRRLSPLSEEIYHGLSGGREQLTLSYEPTRGYEGHTREELAAMLEERLTATQADDFDAGFTTTGPHREDLAIAIDGLSARTFGSQGQQRSAVLSLKMAEASMLREVTGEYPVVLLDDVLSELDGIRQDYLVSHLHDWQVFITCCDPAAICRLTKGRLFLMENGRLREGD